jgi:addiction module RelE/StbE family toxin
MNINYSKSFDEQCSTLSKMNKSLTRNAIELFIDDAFSKGLRNHPLKGDWINYRSIAANDDVRVHHRIIDKTTALFVAIGTHDALYR